MYTPIPKLVPAKAGTALEAATRTLSRALGGILKACPEQRRRAEAFGDGFFPWLNTYFRRGPAGSALPQPADDFPQAGALAVHQDAGSKDLSSGPHHGQHKRAQQNDGSEDLKK
jgi:hypothetical protein